MGQYEKKKFFINQGQIRSRLINNCDGYLITINEESDSKICLFLEETEISHHNIMAISTEKV